MLEFFNKKYYQEVFCLIAFKVKFYEIRTYSEPRADQIELAASLISNHCGIPLEII